MSERPNHMIAGLVFVAVCVVLAVIIYVLAQPVSRASANNSSAEATTTDNTIMTDYLPPTVEQADQGEVVDTSSFPPVPPSLGVTVGQDYASVRKRLFSLGFKPMTGASDCSPYSTARGEPCFDRPEISSCAGSGKGYCDGSWSRGDLHLDLVTIDGPDGLLDNAVFSRGGKPIPDPGLPRAEPPPPPAEVPRQEPASSSGDDPDAGVLKPVSERTAYVASCMAAAERDQGGFGSSIDRAAANATCQCAYAHFPPNEMTKAQFVGAHQQCLRELAADKPGFIGRYYLGGGR